MIAQQNKLSFQDGTPLFISFSNRNFGIRLSLRKFRRVGKNYYLQIGVFGNKTTHFLRHTAITKAIDNGVDPVQVKEMARHNSIDTTLGYFYNARRLENPAEDSIDY